MEKEEFKQVWLPLSGGFYRAAYQILGSEADARDAVQDLFIKLWNRREKLSEIASPQAYGTRMIRNICLDRLRKAGIPAEDIEQTGTADISDEIFRQPDRVMVSREMLVRLKETVAGLPQKQQEVVELRFFRQMEYDEIVAATGLSYINVRVLVNRARKTILSAMKDYLTEYRG